MLSDLELDQLLAHASQPIAPKNFEQDVLAKLGNTVVAFPQKKKANLFLIGLPLAASLALGLWLGSAGTVDGFIPQLNTTIAVNDDEPVVNLDNLDLLVEGQQS
jgi:hypothetical protein